MLSIRSLGCIAVLLLYGMTGAAALPKAWIQAEQAYRTNDYPTAILAFEDLVREGYRSAALFYNLGNCYVQLGAKGKAVLAYERALRIDPGNPQIEATLKLVRNMLEDQISGVVEYSWLRYIRTPQTLLAVSSWLWIGIFLIWIGAGVWIFRRLKPEQWVSPYWKTATRLSLGVGLCFVLIGIYSYYSALNHKEAIVLAKEAVLYLAPDPLSPKSREIHEGAKVRIMEQLETWNRIELENGDAGWVQAKALAAIAF